MNTFIIIGSTGGFLFLIACIALIVKLGFAGFFSIPAASAHSEHGKRASTVEAGTLPEVSE